MSNRIYSFLMLILFFSCDDKSDDKFTYLVVGNIGQDTMTTVLFTQYITTNTRPRFPFLEEDKLPFFENAHIYIYTDSQRIELSHRGNSFYSDINRELIIRPGKEYFLEIINGNDTLKSETKIPQYVDFKSLHHGDSLFVEVKQTPFSTYVGNYGIEWELSSDGGPLAVRQILPEDTNLIIGGGRASHFGATLNGVGDRAYITFKQDQKFVKDKYKLIYLDTCFSKYWDSAPTDYRGIGLGPGVDDYLKYTRDLPVASVSNIRGNVSAVGCFGSHNATGWIVPIAVRTMNGIPF